MRFLGWILLATSLGVSNLAAQNAKKYDVDVKTSRVYIRVDPDGRGHAHGIVGRLSSGTIAFGDKTGKLVFDQTSFSADEPAARKYVGLDGTMSDSDRRSITASMRGPLVLDVEKHPTATFTITAVTPMDKQEAGKKGRYRLEGLFNLHGVEKKIGIDATVDARDSGALHLRGQFTLLQTDYGIKPFSALFGAVRVKNELRIYGDLYLNPQGK